MAKRKSRKKSITVYHYLIFSQLIRKKVICRICGKETEMPLLQRHSDLCRVKEEMKKEEKNIDDELIKFFAKSEKAKKHYAVKIQLVKFFL